MFYITSKEKNINIIYKQMEIIKNLKTEYHICYSVNADECTRFAASELQKYVYKSTKCLIPVFSDKCERRGKEIHLGNARNNDYSKFASGLSSEGFVITTNSEDIVFYSASPRGSLYAVYYFLDKYFGFRVFSNDLEKIDYKDELIIDTLNIRKDFPFEYREAYWTDAFKSNFASKNMLNSNLADLSKQKGGKLKWFNFHHSFSDLVNPKEWFFTHPEYFSEIDGKRISEHTELCLSNPDVFTLALNKVKEWIKNNPECKVFSVAQDEWMGHFTKMACECENCKKIDEKYESQSGSIINFVNKIALEIKKEYPDVLIHTFAYQYSRKPPAHIKPEDNVIVRLTNIECSWARSIEEGRALDKKGRNAMFLKDLVNWSKLTNRLYIWDYAVNYRNYLLPFPCLRSMYKNISLYKKIGVKGLLMEGNFSYGGNGYLDNLKAYISSRLMGLSEEPLEVMVNEFCDAFYGKASKWVQEYIYLFEDAVSNYDLWLYDDADSLLFNDALVKKASIIMEKILSSVSSTDEEYTRVLQFNLCHRYMVLVRLPMDTKDRDKLIDEFSLDIRSLGITELFERTNLDYSIEVLKKSQYAKDRDNWYSLYYLMK